MNAEDLSDLGWLYRARKLREERERIERRIREDTLRLGEIFRELNALGEIRRA